MISNKKAQVTEAMNFTVATIIIILILLISITATVFLAGKKPAPKEQEQRYARTSQEFDSKLFLQERDEKSGQVLQAMLNTEKEFEGRKILFKDLLLEFPTAPEKQKYANFIQQTAVELFSKMITEKISSENVCAYFEVNYSEENEINRIYVSSLSSRSYSDAVYKEKEKKLIEKAAHIDLESKEKEVHVYLYYSNKHESFC